MTSAAFETRQKDVGSIAGFSRKLYIVASSPLDSPPRPKCATHIIAMIKTNKFLRLKTKNNRLLDVVREHYLRKDVPCHSEICTECEQGLKTECFLFCKRNNYRIQGHAGPAHANQSETFEERDKIAGFV